ncbi:MAG: hypothetical protein R3300_15140, partial [Candidatus Promineifilaceae bacterium]|nr:hypothetical protein [Candidatus Promineifilaceae bacterium]
MGQPSRAIDARIQAGDVSGQIAVGEHIYQNQYLSAEGDIVFRQADASLTELRRIAGPSRAALRPFRAFLGRAQELSTASRALNNGEPVELYGRQGVGKS